VNPTDSIPLRAEIVGGSSEHRPQSRSIDCSCNREKIQAVHVYLERHFPDYALHDLHAPSRLMQGGLSVAHAEHHVISIMQEGVLTYYAVLPNDFLEHSIEAIEWCLREWKFAEVVRANRIALIFRDGASSLFL
jgi:hypothetical protein